MYRRNRRTNVRRRFYGGVTKKRYGRMMVKRALNKMRRTGLSVFKIRTNPAFTSDGSGEILYGISTTNPALTTSVNGGAYVNACGDWSNLVTLYDSYRVFAVKIKFVPRFPNNLSATTNFKPIYVYCDYDSPTVVTNTNNANEYENCKMKNLFMPWTVFYRIPKTLNLASNSTIVSFGWMDIANPQPTGHIGMFSDGLSATSNYGDLQVTYYVGCKNRR